MGELEEKTPALEEDAIEFEYAFITELLKGIVAIVGFRNSKDKFWRTVNKYAKPIGFTLGTLVIFLLGAILSYYYFIDTKLLRDKLMDEVIKTTISENYLLKNNNKVESKLVQIETLLKEEMKILQNIKSRNSNVIEINNKKYPKLNKQGE